MLEPIQVAIRMMIEKGVNEMLSNLFKVDNYCYDESQTNSFNDLESKADIQSYKEISNNYSLRNNDNSIDFDEDYNNPISLNRERNKRMFK